MLKFTKELVKRGISPADLELDVTDREALKFLKQDWKSFCKAEYDEQKNRFKGIVNLANKLRFSNLSLSVDTALLEGHAERVLRQNFEIANLAEEAMSKNLYYESILRKNGIKIDGLENVLDVDKHERKTRDLAMDRFRFIHD